VIRIFEHFWQDLLFGFRIMGKQPWFSATAVFALTIGIGFVTCQFTVINGFLLRPLPFEEADRLLDVSPAAPDEPLVEGKAPQFDLSVFLQFRELQTSFESLSGFMLGTINVSNGKSPQRYDGSFVTHDFDDVLRVKPVLGRTFAPEDGVENTEPCLLISHRVWQRDFAGDQGVVDAEVLINSEPGRIVGVMPPKFHFPEKEDAWLILPELLPEDIEMTEQSVRAVGRLRAGVSVDEAQIDGDETMARIAGTFPDHKKEHTQIRLQSIQRSVIPSLTVTVLWVMQIAVFFVLFIACANVANLLLARSAVRGRELAIRSALGASRRRIIMQMLSESLVLCLLGAIGGVIYAVWAMEWVGALVRDADLPYWIDFSLDARIMVFVCVVTVVSAFVSGIIPAIKASRHNVNDMLKDGGQTSSGLHIGVFTKSLIVVQISLSFALLVLAGLMIRSVNVQDRMGLSFDPKDVLGARFGLFEGEYPENADLSRFARELVARLAEHKSIEAASVTTRVEFSSSYQGLFRTDTTPDDADDVHAYFEAVLPGYFNAIGTRVVSGRDFSEADTAESEAVVIVNESFARRHWAAGPALDRLVAVKTEMDADIVWARVVGVAPDLHMIGLDGSMAEGDGLYLPYTQKPARFMTVVLRGTKNIGPQSLVPVLRRTVQSLDRNLPLYWVRSYQDSIERMLTATRVVTTMFVAFGSAALFLAAMGIFAVVTFSVNQRKSEIGIRMALGARVSDIKGLVVRQGFLQLIAGLVVGVVLSVMLSSLLKSALLGVRAYDIEIYLLSTAILTIASTAACVLPARKAARVDPMVTLRNE
jgi:predicted permease